MNFQSEVKPFTFFSPPINAIVKSNEMVLFSNRELIPFTIEEVDDSYSIPTSESGLIEEVEDDEKEICYSDYVFEIELGDKCLSCNLDALTLIQSNEDLFHRFLKTNTNFQKSMFNLIKNVIQSDCYEFN